ncbi:MAG: hypothetical protein RSA22_06685 [Acinetobacter sp.]
MSRLQAGSLALNLNSGEIVTLINFEGKLFFDGVGFVDDVWRVKSNTFHVLHDNNIKKEFGVHACELLPLGDDKGIELYKLKEELIEEQSQ